MKNLRQAQFNYDHATPDEDERFERWLEETDLEEICKDDIAELLWNAYLGNDISGRVQKLVDDEWDRVSDPDVDFD